MAFSLHMTLERDSSRAPYIGVVRIIYIYLHLWITSAVLLQDIVKDLDIKLDWFFKMSLVHDIVSVSGSNIVFF